MKWPIIDCVVNTHVHVNQQSLVNFTSNDYLGMAIHPELKQYVANCVMEYGVGSTGSRRLSGNHQLFLNTESYIADWIGKEAAVLFNSGYQMNSSLFSLLADENTLIVADKLSHASLIDGIMQSNARFIRFRHNDSHHLRIILDRYASQYDRVIIVCESVYSMDGDEAPLQEIIAIKQLFHAQLIVDEAHSIGIFGSNGNGWCNSNNLLDDVDILLVPFGKAFGLSGAMAVGTRALIDLIRSRCRGYIYSTALPLPIVAGIQKSCELIQKASHQRAHLMCLVRLFKTLLPTRSESAIQPIIIGDMACARAYESRLIDGGFFVRSVHHPTVPRGQSRLRLTFNANLSDVHIRQLATAISQLEIEFDQDRSI